MPMYEYHCKDCAAYTEINATIEQKQKGLEVICNVCGSRNVEQVFGGFSITTGQSVKSKKDSGGGCCGDSGCC
jgi:putative FmdB family regulatory protein